MQHEVSPLRAQDSLTSRNAALEDFVLRQQAGQPGRSVAAGESNGDNACWLDGALCAVSVAGPGLRQGHGIMARATILTCN